MQPRALIIGGDSMIGHALASPMIADGWQVVCTSRRSPLPADARYVDLSQPSIDPALENERFAVAIFCAGFTGLQACRDNPATSRQINVDSTLSIARLLATRGTFLIHLSTNLVFDGSKAFPPETSPVSPQTEYGRQKADAERGILGLGIPAAVVRLTKVFHSGLPLLRKWLANLHGGKGVTAFDDMPVSPVLLKDVVRGLSVVSRQRAVGVWHFSGPADYSYFDVARLLEARAGASHSSAVPASAALLQPPPYLPAFSALGTELTHRKLGLDFPGLPDVLDSLVQDGLVGPTERSVPCES
jgi:dTDP-4-dehydrorhamnose reductase